MRQECILGNSICNSLKGAFVCDIGKTTIFANCKGGIYESCKDTPICDDVAKYINYYSGYIYYLNMNDWNIFRIKPDGSGKELFIGDGGYFAIENGILVFEQRVDKSTKQLKRILIESLECTKTIIENFERQCGFCLHDGVLYYIDNKKLVCSDFSGNTRVIAEDSNIIDFCIDSNHVYYANSDKKGTTIYSIDLDDNSKSVIKTVNSYFLFFIVVNQNIYYFNCENSMLYIFNKQNQTYAFLPERIAPAINYSDGYIYYYDYDERWALKRINLKTYKKDTVEANIEDLRMSNLANQCLSLGEYPVTYGDKIYTISNDTLYTMNLNCTVKTEIFDFTSAEYFIDIKIIGFNQYVYFFQEFPETEPSRIIYLKEGTVHTLYSSNIINAIMSGNTIYFFEENKACLELKKLEISDKHAETLVSIQNDSQQYNLDWLLHHGDDIYYCLDCDEKEHIIFQYSISKDTNKDLTPYMKNAARRAFIYNGDIYYTVNESNSRGHRLNLYCFDLKTKERSLIYRIMNSITNFLIANNDIYYWSAKDEDGLSPIYRVSSNGSVVISRTNNAGSAYCPEVGKALINQVNRKIIKNMDIP
jgi:hypothetical protein